MTGKWRYWVVVAVVDFGGQMHSYRASGGIRKQQLPSLAKMGSCTTGCIMPQQAVRYAHGSPLCTTRGTEGLGGSI